METPRRLVIVGEGATAEIAHEYFTWDSDYEVVGFSVEREYLKRDTFEGLPVAPFEDVEQAFDPALHSFYAAISFTQNNALRTRLYQEAKAKGYAPATYVSSRAFVARSAHIGEHCFIFENNVVQPFTRIGNNVTLWSGNHIGHHSTVGDNCFISSHVVLSGFGNVGASCFIGVNTTIADNVTIGANCLVGAGALILGSVPDHTKVIGTWKKSKTG